MGTTPTKPAPTIAERIRTCRIRFSRSPVDHVITELFVEIGTMRYELANGVPGLTPQEVATLDQELNTLEGEINTFYDDLFTEAPAQAPVPAPPAAGVLGRLYPELEGDQNLDITTRDLLAKADALQSGFHQPDPAADLSGAVQALEQTDGGGSDYARAGIKDVPEFVKHAYQAGYDVTLPALWPELKAVHRMHHSHYYQSKISQQTGGGTRNMGFGDRT
jgi:hypothetical protein